MQDSQIVHPLLKKKITGIGTWEQFLKRWDRTNVAEELAGLLQIGFSVEGLGNRVIEKALFYLEVANGHATEAGRERHMFFLPGEKRADHPEHGEIENAFPGNGRGDRDTAGLRRVVAEKAWEVLCVKFFANLVTHKHFSETEFSHFPYWGELYGNEELIARLLKFFDPEEDNNYCAGKKHHQEVSQEFVAQLVKTLWRDTTLRPQLCRLLGKIYRLKLLLKLPFDECGLTFLATLANRKNHDNIPIPIEVQAAHGSEDARLWLLLKNRQQVEQQKEYT